MLNRFYILKKINIAENSVGNIIYTKVDILETNSSHEVYIFLHYWNAQIHIFEIYFQINNVDFLNE
jgi:hypothetical protein